MNALVLDTSAYSAFKRGQFEAVQAVRRAAAIILPTVVVGELLAGFATGSRAAENRAELDAFVASPRVRVVPVSWDTAERYAHIYAYLRQMGRPIPTNDIWIAACTMTQGAELLTADGHFRHLPQVVIRFLEP